MEVIGRCHVIPPLLLRKELPILILLGSLKAADRASLNAEGTQLRYFGRILYPNLYSNQAVAGTLSFDKLSEIILCTIIVILFK
jgi:hypothetical protein